MTEYAIIVLGLCLVVFFVLIGAAVPVFVFWYNREDARIFDDMRGRFIDELSRLQMDVDDLHERLDRVRSQLYEEKRQRAIARRDLETQTGINIGLGGQVAELQQQLAKMEDMTGCPKRLARMEQLYNGLVDGIGVLTAQLETEGITPQWRPAAYPPRDGEMRG